MADPEPISPPDAVAPDDWTLQVTGSIDEPLSLSRADLTSLPLETFTGEFDCVRTQSAADRSWRGARVEALLSRAGLQAGSDCGLVRAMDGDYACSFTLEQLRSAVLAVELDGAPLPPARGGPARLVPTRPDRDCWESVKWVSEIEVLDGPTDEDTARQIALSRTD